MTVSTLGIFTVVVFVLLRAALATDHEVNISRGGLKGLHSLVRLSLNWHWRRIPEHTTGACACVLYVHYRPCFGQTDGT